MNAKFTQDELIAKEWELFGLSPDKDQTNIRQLAKDLDLHNQYAAGGYISWAQYKSDGPPVTLQQLMKVAAFWGDEDYLSLLLEQDTKDIDWDSVRKVAELQQVGGLEVLALIKEVSISRKEEIFEDEGVHSPAWSRKSSMDMDDGLVCKLTGEVVPDEAS